MMHFRLSFHCQAFDDVWSFRSCSFKASRRKNNVEVLLNDANVSAMIDAFLTAFGCAGGWLYSCELVGVIAVCYVSVDSFYSLG